MSKKKHSVEAVEGQLLREIRKLTSRQFVYEDGWCGMVPFDGKLSELQTGPPVSFVELSWREQADVLRSFVRWDRYPERAWDDEYRIRDNIAAGMRPEEWLEGTSLRESFRLLAEGRHRHRRSNALRYRSKTFELPWGLRGRIRLVRMQRTAMCRSGHRREQKPFRIFGETTSQGKRKPRQTSAAVGGCEKQR